MGFYYILHRPRKDVTHKFSSIQNRVIALDLHQNVVSVHNL